MKCLKYSKIPIQQKAQNLHNIGIEKTRQLIFGKRIVK